MAPPLPSARACWLADARVEPTRPTSALLISDLPLGRLSDIEAAWSPARDRVAALASDAGGSLESQHWDWREKIWSTGPDGHRLFAIECEGDVQGLMAAANLPRRSALAPERWVSYVDYLETAPWNQRVPGQRPRFLGAGFLLMSEAVRQSAATGFGGLVGLHALPQAESFYVNRCQMTRLGPDSTYQDLVYFELHADVAAKWIADGSPQ